MLRQVIRVFDQHHLAFGNDLVINDYDYYQVRREDEWREEPEEICRLAFLSEKILHGQSLHLTFIHLFIHIGCRLAFLSEKILHGQL